MCTCACACICCVCGLSFSSLETLRCVYFCLIVCVCVAVSRSAVDTYGTGAFLVVLLRSSELCVYVVELLFEFLSML